MTKKRFLAFFVVAIMALSCLCVALVGCGGDADDNKLSAIELKTDTVKTDYIAGQTLDLTGLEVTAVYGKGDKATKEVVTDYTATPAAGAALKTTDKTVKISFTKDGATASKSFSINVHNDIVDATQKTAPTKVKYLEDQPFSVAGMSFEVEYENGEKAVIEATAENTTVTPAKMGEDTKEITVTFAGKEFKVAVEKINGVFIEAEDGILPEGSVLCIDGLNNDEAHRPSGTGYVGDFNADDTKDLRMTFLFTSDKAGKGDVEFRMASQYLKQDNNWTPIWMGDVQLNKICDVFVNDKPITVPDTAILEGGGEENGTPDGTLWLNWQTVELKNVDLVEGKNSVELKFKEHDYKDCSRDSKNGVFTANIDSLIVTSEDCAISKYIVSLDTASVKPTGVTLEKGQNEDGDEVPYYVITGTVNFTGYTDEQAAEFFNKQMNKTVKGTNANQFTFNGFGFDFQGNLSSKNSTRYLNTVDAREVTMTSVENKEEGAGANDRIGTFTIKVDVSSLGINEDGNGLYSTHFDVAGGTSKNFDFIVGEGQHKKDDLDTSMVSADPIKVGYNTYTLVYEPWFANNIGDPDYYAGDRQAHCYGTVGISIVDKTKVEEVAATGVKLAKDDEDKLCIEVSGTAKVTEYTETDAAKYIADNIAFALKSGNNNYLNAADLRNVKVTKDGEADADGVYTANFTVAVSLDEFVTEGTFDVTFNGAALAIDAANVTESNDNTKYFNFALAATEADAESGKVGATVTVKSNASIDSYDATAVTLTAGESGLGELTVTGDVTWTLYDDEDVEAAFKSAMKFELKNGNNSFLNSADVRDLAVTKTAEGAGTYTMTVNLYSLAAGDYTVRLNDKDVQVVVATDKVDCGSHAYTLAGTEADAVTVKVEIAANAALTFAERPDSADLIEEGGKAYIVINSTYTSEAYSDIEIKNTIVGRYADFQGNQNAGHANWNTTRIYTTVENVTLGTKEVTTGEGENATTTTVKTFSVKYEIPDTLVNGAYTMHYNRNSNTAAADYKPLTGDNSGKVVIANGKQYTLDVVPGAGGGQHFWGCPGIFVANAPAVTE